MYRKDLLDFSECAQVEELEKYFKNNQPPDKVTLSSAILKCLDTNDFTESHMQTIRILLQNGADLSTKLPNSMSALQKACSKGFLEAVKLFLAHNANAQELDHQQRSLLMLSLSHKTREPLDLLKVLISHGTSASQSDIKKSTALHYAALNGHKGSLEYLLSLGLDPNIRNLDNCTAYNLAIAEDKKACIEILGPLTNKSKQVSSHSTHGAQDYSNSLHNSHSVQVLAKDDKKKFQKEGWDRSRGKGKNPRPYPNTRKTDKDPSCCFNCKQQTEVFCRECAKVFWTDKNEPNDKKGFKELEEISRVQATHIQKLEKELNEFREGHGNKSTGYNVKSKLSPLYMRKFNEKSPEVIFAALQNDILGFVRDQERFLANAEFKYSEAVDVFKNLIQQVIPEVDVEVFGSFSTGLLLPYSDIDLVITHTTTAPIDLLKDLLPHIESMRGIKKLDKIFTASIPVIKVSLDHKNKGEEIKIDITVQENKHKGVECRNLIKKFLGTYKTIKHVYLVLKQLIYFCNFHEPYRGGIGSYGLFLMVAYFYQENYSNWQFSAHDKDGKSAHILSQFFEFYLGRFDYQRCITVEYEGFDSKEYRSKTVKKT
jgi:ankyrin repeat protein/predicted nucleotidyltransferase